jgi:zinc transport system permease protein
MTPPLVATSIEPALAGSGVADSVLDAVLEGLWGSLLDVLASLTGIEMLASSFMQRAYLAAICVALIGPLVGAFLVHREMAMIGDTLAHSAFAGVAAGLFVNSVFALSVPPLLTALVVAAIAALLVQALVEHADAYRDTSLAIVLTGSFAVGSVLITATDGGIAVGINAYLFGSLATVSRVNAGILVGMSLVVVTAVTVTYRPLLHVTFDEMGARAAGLDAARYNRLLAVLTALIVVSAMQIMGVILVAAMLVIPVAAATSVDGFKRSILASIAVGQFATITGVTVSYWYDVAAGGTIVLMAIAAYLAVTLANRLHRRRGGSRYEGTRDADDGSAASSPGCEASPDE